MKPIKNLEDLQKLADNNQIDCFIVLNHGAKSSKQITYYEQDDSWIVYNEIDGSEEEFKSTEEFKKSFVFEALEKGALYKYNF